jgi:hypothetical protein
VKDLSHEVIWREGEEKGVRESRWNRGIILP